MFSGQLISTDYSPLLDHFFASFPRLGLRKSLPGLASRQRYLPSKQTAIYPSILRTSSNDPALPSFSFLAAMNFGIFSHEHLSGRAHIKVFRMLQEILAVNASPNQATIGINIDFGHAQCCCLL